MKRVAINGFGRIGRIFFRQVYGDASRVINGERNRTTTKKRNFDIVAINDLGDNDNLAYLLKYDTVYGRYDKEVQVEGDKLKVDGKEIALLQEKDPALLPWKKLGVDIVVESTGVFETFEKARVHIAAGAKRVVITAPTKDADSAEGKTVLIGVNDGELESVQLSSNGSCTTNAASPVVQILSENPGIEKAMLNTVHGYTATQNLVDGPTKGKDFRRGRAAAQNIVPSTTGAAISVTRAIRELEGKFDGIAMRVPVPAGSIADITFIAKRNTSVEEINDILRAAAKTKRWNGILTVTEDQLVSSDIVGESFGAIVDLKFTKVVGGNLVKVLSWYDNEYGYVSTLVKHVQEVAKLL